eukprot:scaffold168251_cov15-Tisochrysis_lutea.AAC.1
MLAHVAFRERELQQGADTPLDTPLLTTFQRAIEGKKARGKYGGGTWELKLDEPRSRGQAKSGFGKQDGGGKGKAAGSRKKSR